MQENKMIVYLWLIGAAMILAGLALSPLPTF
jgi:hypothetical protein